MDRCMHILAFGLAASLLVTPGEAQTLSSKDKARVARAAPRDQDDVYNCLRAKKKGKKTGTIVGAAGGVATGVIAGGNVGESLLAGGAGALVGRAIGNGTSTDDFCDDVLARNK